MLEQLLQLDTTLFTYLNQLGTPTWDAFWIFITEKRNHIPLMVVLLFLVYKNQGLKPFLIGVVCIALMATWTDQVTNLIKYAIKRPRPCDVNALSETIRFIHKRCSSFSFFSGHSSNSMAVAVMIGCLISPKYQKLFIPLIIWAFCMGYSRIYIGVHYPIDVIIGFIFGALSGYGFYSLFLFLKNKLIKI